jgi:hypothetical protein
MRLEYINDTAGNRYIGINIHFDIVVPYLEQFKSIIGDEYDEYITYQQNRDRGHHHTTVLNVMDFKKINNDWSDDIMKFDIDDFETLGLGTVSKNGNRTYFVVCHSKQLQGFRKKLKLEEIDFHITLGFKHKDVFGLRKNEIIK